MRGRWAMALVTLLLMPAAWGQMRGGGRMAGPMTRPGFAARGPGVSNRGVMVAGSFNGGVRFRTGFGGPFFVNRGFHHRRIFFSTFPWWWSYPVYYPVYSYPMAYDSPRTDYDQNRDLAAQVNELSYEIQRLREEQETRYAPPAQTPANARPEIHEPTLLIFRDKHTQEVENYAIVGQTLWIFSEQRATKVPLSSLDVEATSKANDERGVGFRLPH